MTTAHQDHRHCILVIEDDRDDFFLVNDTLMSVEGQPYRASWCGCYEDAQELLRQQKFDIALVDYQIGVKTGLDFIRDVGPFHPNCPMVLLTGLRSPDIDKAAQEAGAADYLPKDLLSAELLDRTIRYTLEHSKRLSLLNSILQNAASGMVALNDAMEPVVWNLRALQALDINKPFNWVSRQEIVDRLEDLFEGKKVPDEFRNAAGQTFETKISVVDSVGHLIAFNDISERVAEGETLRQTAQSAEEAYRSQSQLLAKVSHELRTPLHGISGMARLLDKGDIDDEQRRSVATIQQCSESLLKLINDLLDLSKFDAGAMEANVVDYKLGDVVDNVTHLLGPTAHENGLELSAFVDPALRSELRGDPDRLTQVLINLVGNAIKFTDHGAVSISAVEVTISGCRMIQFEVTDTGPGIAEADQQKLFQKFTQIAASHCASGLGTGLGLALCKEIVALYNGEIGCKSSVGEGSCFWFRVPAISADDVIERIARRQRSAASDLSFLVVAPESVGRQTLVRYLQSLGAKVHCGSTEQAAMELLQAAQIDHLLFDRYEDDRAADALVSCFRHSTDPQRALAFCLCPPGGGASPGDDLFDEHLPRPLSPATIDKLCEAIKVKTQPETVIKPKEATAATSLSMPERRLRVMVVDDNEPNRQIARAMLRNDGYQPDIAESGLQAIELVKQQQFDVILMDVCMPGIDGFETTRRIRALDQGANLSIIGLTAGFSGHDDDGEKNAGMDAVLFKPIDWDELLAILDELDDVACANTSGTMFDHNVTPDIAPDVDFAPLQAVAAAGSQERL